MRSRVGRVSDVSRHSGSEVGGAVGGRGKGGRGVAMRVWGKGKGRGRGGGQGAGAGAGITRRVLGDRNVGVEEGEVEGLSKEGEYTRGTLIAIENLK